MLDQRGDLTLKFADTITEIKPRAFLMENVPGLLTIDGGKQFSRLINQFNKSGFQVTYGVLCAADYGAATLRKRLFVIGARDSKPVTLPLPTHCDLSKLKISQSLFTPTLKPWVPCGPRLNDPGALEVLTNQTFVKHKEEIVERFAALDFGERDHKRRRNRLNPNLPSSCNTEKVPPTKTSIMRAFF
jgi:DNA (cytosine-5)-methyltransferase 1